VGRKKKEVTALVNNMYFGEKEEKAVFDYNVSDSFDEKNKIYNEILRTPFKKMIESIIRRYPIHLGCYDITDVENNALSHLIEHMIKFDPNRIGKKGNKTKAYSYCQTIVRNYFKDHSKKTYLDKKINLFFDDYIDDVEAKDDYLVEIDNSENNEMECFLQGLIDKIQDTIETNKLLKQSEIIVGEAVINILNNWHILFLEETPIGKYNKKVTNKFAKNKIILYLKELTNLSTKDIRQSLKPFKDLYFLEKSDYLADNDE
jgi:hypothetical protein